MIVRCPSCGSTEGEFLVTQTYKATATGIVTGSGPDGLEVDWVDAGQPEALQQPHLQHDCGHEWPTTRPVNGYQS